jgi:hypothetical protein
VGEVGDQAGQPALRRPWEFNPRPHSTTHAGSPFKSVHPPARSSGIFLFLAGEPWRCDNSGIRSMGQVRPERKPLVVYRFSSPLRRPVRGRPTIAAVITLVAFLGSLAAIALGPAAGDPTASPLLLLFMLIRG